MTIKNDNLPKYGSNKIESVQGTQTVQRAVRLLKLIATNTTRGVRLTEIAREMEMTTPTVHRLLKALVAENLLSKNKATHRYSLGSLIFELGLAATHDFNIIDMCTPALKTLAHKTADTSFLFVRSNNDAVCIAREIGAHHMQTPVVQVGCRQPLGVSAGGLALLSALPTEEMEEILAMSAMRLDIYGGLTIEETRALYNKSNKQGYSDTANRVAPGVRGIGMPIINTNGTPIAAVAVAATVGRMTDARVEEILPDLKAAAEEIRCLLQERNTLWELNAPTP